VRIEDAVPADHVVDGGLRHGGHLDGRGLLGFGFLFLRASGGEECGDNQRSEE
jgi:hypothetical protein